MAEKEKKVKKVKKVKKETKLKAKGKEETTNKRKKLKKTESQPQVPRIDTTVRGKAKPKKELKSPKSPSKIKRATKDRLGLEVKSPRVKKDKKKKKKKKVKLPTAPKSLPPAKPVKKKKKKKTPKSPKQKLNELHEFLKSIELDEYIPLMQTEELDMETFLLLNDSDLQGMEIPLGHRKKMLIAIQKRGSKSVRTPAKDGTTTDPESGAATTTTEGSVETNDEPPKVDNRHKGILIHDFVGDENEFQLTLQKGDIVYIVEKHDSGWWWGETMDGTKGYFPGNYVKMAPRSERALNDAIEAEKREAQGEFEKKRKALRLALSGQGEGPKVRRLSRMSVSGAGTLPIKGASPGRRASCMAVAAAEAEVVSPPKPSGNGLMTMSSMKRAGVMKAPNEEARLNTRRGAEDIPSEL